MTFPKYEWQQALLDALLELDSELLPEKVAIAERTITARLRDPQQPDEEEQAALNDALHILRVIFRD